MSFSWTNISRNCVAGLLVAFLTAAFSSSLASLLATGGLDPEGREVPKFGTAFLLTAVVTCLVTSLGSSLPPAIAGPDPLLAAVLHAAAIDAASSLQLPTLETSAPFDPRASNATAFDALPIASHSTSPGLRVALAVFVLASAACSVCLLLVGCIGQGAIFYRVPRTVIAGFLAGCGLVILDEAVGMMTAGWRPLRWVSLRPSPGGESAVLQLKMVPVLAVGAAIAAFLAYVQEAASRTFPVVLPATVLASTCGVLLLLLALRTQDQSSLSQAAGVGQALSGRGVWLPRRPQGPTSTPHVLWFMLEAVSAPSQIVLGGNVAEQMGLLRALPDILLAAPVLAILLVAFRTAGVDRLRARAGLGPLPEDPPVRLSSPCRCCMGWDSDGSYNSKKDANGGQACEDGSVLYCCGMPCGGTYLGDRAGGDKLQLRMQERKPLLVRPSLRSSSGGSLRKRDVAGGDNAGLDQVSGAVRGPGGASAGAGAGAESRRAPRWVSSRELRGVAAPPTQACSTTAGSSGSMYGTRRKTRRDGSGRYDRLGKGSGIPASDAPNGTHSAAAMGQSAVCNGCLDTICCSCCGICGLNRACFEAFAHRHLLGSGSGGVSSRNSGSFDGLRQGLKISTKEDGALARAQVRSIDRALKVFDTELEAAGASCAAAAAVGGPPGLLEFALSAFAVQAGGSTRLVGLSAAAGLTGILLFARPLMRWVPIPVMGGLLAYVGLHLVLDWLVVKRYVHASKDDWASAWVIWITCIACVMVGLVPGAILGFVVHWVATCCGYQSQGSVMASLGGAAWRQYMERKQLQAAEAGTSNSGSSLPVALLGGPASAYSSRAALAGVLFIKLRGVVGFKEASQVLHKLRSHCSARSTKRGVASKNGAFGSEEKVQADGAFAGPAESSRPGGGSPGVGTDAEPNVSVARVGAARQSVEVLVLECSEVTAVDDAGAVLLRAAAMCAAGPAWEQSRLDSAVHWLGGSHNPWAGGASADAEETTPSAGGSRGDGSSDSDAADEGGDEGNGARKFNGSDVQSTEAPGNAEESLGGIPAVVSCIVVGLKPRLWPALASGPLGRRALEQLMDLRASELNALMNRRSNAAASAANSDAEPAEQPGTENGPGAESSEQSGQDGAAAGDSKASGARETDKGGTAERDGGAPNGSSTPVRTAGPALQRAPSLIDLASDWHAHVVRFGHGVVHVPNESIAMRVVLRAR